MHTRFSILSEALEFRKQEILMYQINIDNYTLAIELVRERFPEDEGMRGFLEDLQSRLEAEIFEQRKSQILHDVIEQQLSRMEEEQ